MSHHNDNTETDTDPILQHYNMEHTVPNSSSTSPTLSQDQIIPQEDKCDTTRRRVTFTADASVVMYDDDEDSHSETKSLEATVSSVSATETTYISWYILFVAILSAVGGFLFGYDTGIVSGAMLFIQEELKLDTLQVEFVVGATTFGAILGGVGAGHLSDLIGRRPVTLISSFIFLVGALMMALAPGYHLLLAGRLVVGIGVGLASMVVPTYISEVSPKEFRGQLVTMNVVMVTGGQVIAYCTSALLSSAEHGWRIMFALAAIPPIIQMIGMPWLPESPRYLLRRRGHTLAENRMAARRVLLRVYTSAPVRFGRYQRISTSECAPIRAEQSEAIVALVESELAAIEYAASQTANTTYADLFKYRRSLFIACGLQAFQQLCGFNTAMYYAATILRMGGFHEKENAVKFSIFIAATNMVMTLVALRYIDRVGRRRMLLYTVAAMAVGLMLLGWAFALLLGLHTFQPNCADYTTCGACVADDRCAFAIDRCLRRDQVLLPDSLIVNVDEDLPRGTLQCTGTDAGSWLALAALIFYVAAYALGLGNIPWLIQSELFPLALRGRASGIATSVNWSCNLLVAVTFLSLTHAITAAGTFWLYGSLAIVGWWFVWRYVPETAGRTLEELSEHCITMERRGQTIESP